MKRYIYGYVTLLLVVGLMLLVGCDKMKIDSPQDNIAGDGEVVLALNLKLQGAKVQAVATRTAWADKENVDKIKGTAFVFGNDPGTGTYGDNSPLLQKVAFKSNSLDGTVYVVLDEQDEACFIRLMTSMTQAVRDEINEFVSVKDITDGTATGDVTTFEDYKHISVGLDGYYESVTEPDPNSLTPNDAFPLASPGVVMPDGLSEETVAELNKNIQMVPVASKVDLRSTCDFTLSEVTLLNGARKAHMRSTVLKDNGVTVIESLPLPVNLGGVVQFAPIEAVGNTTEATPIYFFPNEGDDPKNAEKLDPPNEYPNNGSKLSDEVNSKNPTYLIVKGRAAGYSVEGYYKIAIVYKPTLNEEKFTYNIVRNNHYKVNLNKVDNPGYTSFDEAVAGPANDIAYDIVIDGGNTSQDDTFTDSRAETIVSHNGFFYIELVGSEIFAQGYGDAGLKGSVGLSLTRNPELPNMPTNDEDPAGYDVPTLYITATDGITINNNATIEADNFVGSINFTAKQSGTITLRCGDMLKEIPVHYEAMPHIYASGTTIGGESLGTISSLTSDEDESYIQDADMINKSNGEVKANTTYKNREFRGKAYPSDRSKGIRKLYLVQASNFDLWDNVTKNEATLNQTFIYQSTGNIYKYNGVEVTNLANNDARSYTALGEVERSKSGDMGLFPSSGWGSAEFSFEPTNIYKNNNVSHIYNYTRVTENDKVVDKNIATLTLTNIAGEVKAYTFKIDQYALPYPKTDYTEDEQGRWIFQGGTADLYWDHNRGSKLNYITVYNCDYHAVPNKDDITQLGYHWEDKYFNKTEENNGMNHLVYAIAPQHDDDNCDASVVGTQSWYGLVTERAPGISNREEAEGYFVLTVGNNAKEHIMLYIYYKRDDY